MRFLESKHLADVSEELLGQTEVLVGRDPARGHDRHRLVDHHRHVRHHAHHRHVFGQVLLHERGPDPRREADHEGCRGHVRADLAEQRVDVLRLGHQDERAGPLRRLGVVQRRSDPVLATELARTLVAPAGHHDLVGGSAARPDQPADQGLPHLAAAEECHGALGHHVLTRLLTKNQRLAGRSAIRRVRYGYHSVPYGMYTRTGYPWPASSACRSRRTPYSIWNSTRERASSLPSRRSRTPACSRSSCVATSIRCPRSSAVTNKRVYARSTSRLPPTTIADGSRYAPFTSRMRQPAGNVNRSSGVRRR